MVVVVFVFCLFVYLESKNKQANLPNYMISTKRRINYKRPMKVMTLSRVGSKVFRHC